MYSCVSVMVSAHIKKYIVWTKFRREFLLTNEKGSGPSGYFLVSVSGKRRQI